ncbi:hypothetical protein SHIRM173S_07992 [Streptomyces hirsutus]
MMVPFMSISAPPELPGVGQGRVGLDRLVRRSALYVVAPEPVSPLNCRPPNSNGHPPPCGPGLLLLPLAPRSVGDRHVTVERRDDAAGDRAGQALGGARSPRPRRRPATPAESPSVAAVRPEAFVQLDQRQVLRALRADDLRGVRLAVAGPSPRSARRAATTWLLVTISPSLVMITPEPVDEPALEVGADLDDARADRLGDPGHRALLAGRARTFVLLALGAATVAPPASSVDAVRGAAAHQAAATIATAASSATGPRFRFRRGWGAAGSDAWGESAGVAGCAAATGCVAVIGSAAGIGRVAVIGSAGSAGCAAVVGCPVRTPAGPAAPGSRGRSRAGGRPPRGSHARCCGDGSRSCQRAWRPTMRTS